MASAQRSVPVEEQLKNAKAMILMAAKQPIVREALKAYAAEHFSESERALATAAARKPSAVRSISTGQAVESAVFLLQGKFSYIEVLERVDEQGNPLRVKNRRTAVGSVLNRLCQRKIIRAVHKGIGGKPSYYEHFPKLDDSTHSFYLCRLQRWRCASRVGPWPRATLQQCATRDEARRNAARTKVGRSGWGSVR
jgi:hypothetical protein